MNRLCQRYVPLLLVCILVGLFIVELRAADPVDVVFTAQVDGSEQRYVVVLPEDFRADVAHSVLIALHGHGSDRWQFVKDGRGECKAARDAAAKHRLIYVSPDYRAKTSWMGPKAEADVVQIIEDLKAKYRVHKVIVSGGSMGGTAALTFAALHPDLVDGVVSLNGTANLVEYDQFQDAIAASFGGSKKDQPDEYRKRSAELHADRLTMPIAATTGGKDRLVPPDSVLRLVELLKTKGRPVKLIHRPEGGHSTDHAGSLEAFEFVISELAKAEKH
jgi:dipeptidyl aminopeptidase/acylaminoacyl peptidase